MTAFLSPSAYPRIACLLTLVAVLGSVSIAVLVPPQHDESLYLSMARGIDAPHYTIPKRPAVGGSHFVGNPPLVVFIAATSRAVFGDDILAQRIVHIAIFLPAFLLFTYLLSRHMFGPRAAVLAVFLAVLVEPLLAYSASVRLDSPLAAAVAAAMYFGFRAVRGRRRRVRYIIGSSIALGIAVFTKYEAVVVPIAFGLYGLLRTCTARRIHWPTFRLLVGHTIGSGLVLGAWFLWVRLSPANLGSLGHVASTHFIPPSLSEFLWNFARMLRRATFMVGLPIFGLAGATVLLRRHRHGRCRDAVAFLLCWIASVLILQFLIERGADRHYLKALPAVLALASALPIFVVGLPRETDDRLLLRLLPPLACVYLLIQLGTWWPTPIAWCALGMGAVALGLSVSRPKRVAAITRTGRWKPILLLAVIVILQQFGTPNHVGRFGAAMREADGRVSAAAKWTREVAGPKGIILVPGTEFGYYAGPPYVFGSALEELRNRTTSDLDIRAFVTSHPLDEDNLRSMPGLRLLRAFGPDVFIYSRMD